MPDPAYAIGVVGSIVPLTIVAFVVFFYMRSRREKEAQHRQSQLFSPDGMDAYKQRPPSMYAPPPVLNTVPYTPYVSLSRGIGLRDYIDFFFFRTPLIHLHSLLKARQVRQHILPPSSPPVVHILAFQRCNRQMVVQISTLYLSLLFYLLNWLTHTKP